MERDRLEGAVSDDDANKMEDVDIYQLSDGLSVGDYCVGEELLLRGIGRNYAEALEEVFSARRQFERGEKTPLTRACIYSGNHLY